MIDYLSSKVKETVNAEMESVMKVVHLADLVH